MNGTVAITDHGWYEFLLAQRGLDEVNFWTPSAHWAFRGEVGSPFFFKLKARHGHAICGFAYFARYARLPDWLAWETFEAKNGCPTLESMRERIGGIRARIDYRAPSPSNEIGCILLAEPTFSFREHHQRAVFADGRNRLDKPGVSQVPQIAAVRVERSVLAVAEIAGRHDAEGPDGGQRAHLRGAQRHIAVSRPHALAFMAARQFKVAREHVVDRAAHVPADWTTHRDCLG